MARWEAIQVTDCTHGPGLFRKSFIGCFVHSVVTYLYIAEVPHRQQEEESDQEGIYYSDIAQPDNITANTDYV